MRRGACLITVALACAVPVVDAATTTHDVVFAGQTEQGLPGWVKLLPGGTGVTAAFSYTTTCTAGDGSILWSGVAKATLKKGHFRYVRNADAKGPGITLKGTVGPTSVTGTWRIQFVTRDAFGTVKDSCDSGVVSWTLPRDGAGGQLARAYPVAVRLGNHLIKTLAFVTQMNCTSGTSYLIPSFYGNFRIANNGTFGKSFTDAGIPSKGVHPNLTLNLHGKLVRGQLQGTWQMKAVFVDSSGKQTDSCDSGKLSWSATA